MALKDIKTLLTGTTDDKLEVIAKLTRERLVVLLSVDEDVPDKFKYIVTDVSIKRFNRISNEGMKSYSQEGLSITFPDSDFDEYADEIRQFRKEKELEANPMRGKFRFL